MWVLVTDLEYHGRAANFKISYWSLLRNSKVPVPLPPRADAIITPSWEALSGPLCLCMWVASGRRPGSGLVMVQDEG